MKVRPIVVMFPVFFDIGACGVIGDGMWDRTVNITKEDHCQASSLPVMVDTSSCGRKSRRMRNN